MWKCDIAIEEKRLKSVRHKTTRKIIIGLFVSSWFQLNVWYYNQMFNHLIELKPSERRRRLIGPDISWAFIHHISLNETPRIPFRAFKPFTFIHVAFCDPCRNRQQQASEGSVDGGMCWWRICWWRDRLWLVVVSLLTGCFSSFNLVNSLFVVCSNGHVDNIEPTY